MRPQPTARGPDPPRENKRKNIKYSMFRGVVTTFITPEVQLQASNHNYKGIIFIPYCKIKWFNLYSVIPIQS